MTGNGADDDRGNDRSEGCLECVVAAWHVKENERAGMAVRIWGRSLGVALASASVGVACYNPTDL
jgi:hypothetical protein